MAKNKHHSLVRIYERAGVKSPGSALRFIHNAKEKGRTIAFYRDLEPFHTYLVNKSKKCGKDIHVYSGFVFVLNKTGQTGTGCTTMYQIPDEFKEEVERYEAERTATKVKFDLLYPRRCKLYRYINGDNVDIDTLRMLFKEAVIETGIKEKFTIKEDGTIFHDNRRVGRWSTLKVYRQNEKNQ